MKNEHIDKNIPDEFLEFIINSKQKVIGDINLTLLKQCENTTQGERKLTKEMALEDLSIFHYLFNNAYSGKDFYKLKGFKFDPLFEEVKQKLKRKNSITSYDLIDFFLSIVHEIHDGHFAFWFGDKFKSLERKKRAYFADVLLKKANKGYLVIKSLNDNITVGSMVQIKDAEKYLFRTLAPPDENHYFLGIRSWQPVNKISLTINDEEIEIPVTVCKTTLAEKDDIGIFKHSNINGYDYVSSSRFWAYHDNLSKRDDEVMGRFKSCGYNLREKNIVIWDLLNNGGGNSDYPMAFLKGLNGYVEWKSQIAILHSPPISYIQSQSYTTDENVKEWTFHTATSTTEKRSYFKGTLYIISNDRIGSSGEIALMMAKCVDNCVIVGQNSRGTGLFGEVLHFQLPNSKICIQLPRKIFLHDVNEGMGIEPDYWINSTNPQKELLQWLNNPDDYIASL